MNDIRYGKQVLLSQTNVDEAHERLARALGEQGFGILSTIDMQATMKTKLDKDFRPYRILSACNPNLAWKGLQSEAHIGLLLPCNVVIQQLDGDVLVSVIDPLAVFAMVDNEQAREVAKEASERLSRVIEQLA